MNGDGFGVGGFTYRPFQLRLTYVPHTTGWYDVVYDEELGSQPCIFTSVTPVRCYQPGGIYQT